MYGLLTKHFLSRWLDGRIILFACLKTKIESRSINRSLNWTSLINKGLIMIWDKEQVFLPGDNPERAR